MFEWYKNRRKNKTNRIYLTLKGLLCSESDVSPDYERVILSNGDTVLRRIKPVEQLNTPDPAPNRTFILCQKKDGTCELREIKE